MGGEGVVMFDVGGCSEKRKGRRMKGKRKEGRISINIKMRRTKKKENE